MKTLEATLRAKLGRIDRKIERLNEERDAIFNEWAAAYEAEKAAARAQLQADIAAMWDQQNEESAALSGRYSDAWWASPNLAKLCSDILRWADAGNLNAANVVAAFGEMSAMDQFLIERGRGINCPALGYKALGQLMVKHNAAKLGVSIPTAKLKVYYAESALRKRIRQMNKQPITSTTRTQEEP